MTADLLVPTAANYLDNEYRKSATTRPAESTSSSYLNKDWVEERKFTRIWIAETELRVEDLRQQEAHATDRIESRYASDLENLVMVCLRSDAKDLLRKLSVQHAIAWVDLAKMLGVSVPAIRKWRMNGGVSYENHAKLARLCGFIELLADRDIKTAWLSAPLVAGYTVAPKHLYSDATASTLIDLAAGGQNARAVLDALAPGWEEKYDARGYEVARFDDGSYGIVSRGD